MVCVVWCGVAWCGVVRCGNVWWIVGCVLVVFFDVMCL